jgi:hypothetical protein
LKDAPKQAPPQEVINSAAQIPQRSQSAITSWYTEVLELRRRAAEYKKRALGTHFSRTHLAQLYAQQAQLWDGEDKEGADGSCDGSLGLEAGSEGISVTSARALEQLSDRSANR